MDSIKNKYKSFDVVDLVLNDNFRQLVLGEESPVLEDLINKFPTKKENIIFASKIVLGIQSKRQVQSLDKKYKLWMRVRHQYHQGKSYSIFRYAAAVLILISLSAGSFFYINKQSEITAFAQTNEIDFNNSRLILTEGKEIALSENEPHLKYTQDGKSVFINDSVRVNQSQEGYNQVIVPYGKRSKVTLSDGSTVWMNSGSRLIYPPQFHGEEREVYLEGEALFEVSKNPVKPFFVRTSEFKIEVVGTTFNVQAYSKENLYNTVLVEGKVKLTLDKHFLSGSITMNSNQIATLTNNHNQFKLKEVENIKNHISWIHGYLEFRNESVDALLKRVASYYNIEINVEGNINQTRINGKLDLKDDPERIMAGIAAILKMEYHKIKDKTYTMYK